MFREQPVLFNVIGTPAPQGSKSTFRTKTGKTVVVEGKDKSQRERHASWRNAVAEAARDEAERLPGPLDGPLVLGVTFRLAMPQSRSKQLHRLGRNWHTSRPDLTKLLRSTEDAMKDGGLIADDSRICRLSVMKIEVVGWTGAEIRVARLTGLPTET